MTTLSREQNEPIAQQMASCRAAPLPPDASVSLGVLVKLLEAEDKTLSSLVASNLCRLSAFSLNVKTCDFNSKAWPYEAGRSTSNPCPAVPVAKTGAGCLSLRKR